MKSLKFIILALCAIVSSHLFAQKISQQKTDTIKVYGECAMCKNRIQEALKIEGVAAANWDTETKLLTITYNPAKISNEGIQKKIAAIGHDTEKYRANDKAYEKLPGCCHYERKKAEAKQNHLQHHE